MTFVIKRKIDELGRLVLPIDHRNHYGITAGDPLLITETEDGILVRKAPEYTDEVKIVDELGRIVIPKRIRATYNLEAKSALEIHSADNGILLKPDTAEPSTTTPVKKASAEPATPGTYDIYEKDYSAERKAYHAMRTAHGADEAFDLIKSRGIMSAIDKRFLELPHVINPVKKLAYDKCLQMLDSWAMLKGANICGTVDYVHFDAHIEMVCPFFEFFEERTFEYLRFLMSGARNITFTPTDDGEIKMRACFDYFEDIGDKDKIIEEEIAKHADVVDALNEAADIDRKIIMSDPVMSGFITQAAEEIGITADEYLDRFEEIIDENPMTILSLLHNEFRKKAEDNTLSNDQT
jgi:AbrB family looped-hinge helix DNA binding protein